MPDPMTPERLAEIEARLTTPRLGRSMARETDLDMLAIRALLAEVRRLQATSSSGRIADGEAHTASIAARLSGAASNAATKSPTTRPPSTGPSGATHGPWRASPSTTSTATHHARTAARCCSAAREYQ